MLNDDQIKGLFAHFELYISLSDTLKQELKRRIHFEVFSKGDFIHRSDRICRKSYFVREGLLRTYFLKDGKEISEYFSAESEWVNSPRSFMQQELDIYNIDALEDTSCYALEVRDLVYLFDQFPEMERYARLSMGNVFGHFMDRITSIRFTSAKERYEHFTKSYERIHQRIPLGMIASYLGITQETLSRIRKQK